jgi:hypothetical protein
VDSSQESATPNVDAQTLGSIDGGPNSLGDLHNLTKVYSASVEVLEHGNTRILAVLVSGQQNQVVDVNRMAKSVKFQVGGWADLVTSEE